MSELDREWDALWKEAEVRGWHETSATRSLTVPAELYDRIVDCARRRGVTDE